MSTEGEREYDASPDCWCEPVLEWQGPNGEEVWVCRSSRGDMPPPDVIAQAIIECLMDEDG